LPVLVVYWVESWQRYAFLRRQGVRQPQAMVLGLQTPLLAWLQLMALLPLACYVWEASALLVQWRSAGHDARWAA
jgi:hypothetical protein